MELFHQQAKILADRIKFGAQLFRSRTASGYVKKAGDAVWARLDEKQTHFFNRRTGESLRIRL